MTLAIQSGTSVVITDVDGTEHAAVALSAIETHGHSFPVIWVGIDRDGETVRLPWPAEAVR